MRRNAWQIVGALPLLMLGLLLTACGSDGPLVRPPVPPKIPALPAQARQPDPPAICRPTCSDGLARLLSSSLNSPTPAVQPASPASASMTR